MALMTIRLKGEVAIASALVSFEVVCSAISHFCITFAADNENKDRTL